MEQEVKKGAIFLVIGNEDGTISPLLLTSGQARIIELIIAETSKDSPFEKGESKYKIIT